ncbi:hypothetical protein [Rhodococcus sovatensis]|uniref:Carboxypeptidase regulatory-like domain-containing protein n=1 Tax=Rhodococcus sovatensis TaxID=1805840 RepID=A0ABZ2PF37_9NOCA
MKYPCWTTPPRRPVLLNAQVVILTAFALVFSAGAAQAQNTDLSAEIDTTTETLHIGINAGEPLLNPTLSILFPPGIAALGEPEICTDRWQVEAVGLASVEAGDGTGAHIFQTRRFTCQLDGIAENSAVSVAVPIELSTSAEQLPVTATVVLRAGTIALDTVAFLASPTEAGLVPCDPEGVSVAGIPGREATYSHAYGAISGSVSSEPHSDSTAVQLTGIDSCHQWIERTVPATTEGEYSFLGLLPGTYKVGIRDSSTAAAVALDTSNMTIADLEL